MRVNMHCPGMQAEFSEGKHRSYLDDRLTYAQQASERVAQGVFASDLENVSVRLYRSQQAFEMITVSPKGAGVQRNFTR